MRDYRSESRVVVLSVLMALAVVCLLAWAVGPSKPIAAGQEPRRPPEAGKAPAADPDPDPGTVYVWPPPEAGVQSLLILEVGDVAGGAAELDCAYLVPVKVKIKTAVEKAELEKLIGGKLIPSKLMGRDERGRVRADLFMGKDGWLSRRKGASP